MSAEAGVICRKVTDNRHFFVLGHPKYDAETLALEYRAGPGRGPARAVPAHYFPDDDPTQAPMSPGASHGQLLYTNWLNYYVYQTTPYDLAKIGAEGPAREGEASQAQGEAQASARLGEAQTGAASTAQGAALNAPQPARSEAPAPRNPYLRPANEDDDGYDPYSDRREEPPLFEPDPWD